MNKLMNLLAATSLLSLAACSSTPRYLTTPLTFGPDKKYHIKRDFAPGEEMYIGFFSKPHLSRAAIDIEEYKETEVQIVDEVGNARVSEHLEFKRKGSEFGWVEKGLSISEEGNYYEYLKNYTAPVNEGRYIYRIFSESGYSLLESYCNYAWGEFTVTEKPKTNSLPNTK